MSPSEKIIADERMTADPSGTESVIESDSLVEEVSIDGMCGVY